MLRGDMQTPDRTRAPHTIPIKCCKNLFLNNFMFLQCRPPILPTRVVCTLALLRSASLNFRVMQKGLITRRITWVLQISIRICCCKALSGMVVSLASIPTTRHPLVDKVDECKHGTMFRAIFGYQKKVKKPPNEMLAYHDTGNREFHGQ